MNDQIKPTNDVYKNIRISDIKVGERLFNRDPDDEIEKWDDGTIYCDHLKSLAKSIEEDGRCLVPIVVNKDNLLICGYRRYLACKNILRWEEILAQIVNVTDPIEIMKMQYDDNAYFYPQIYSERALKTAQRKIGRMVQEKLGKEVLEGKI